MPNTSDKSTAGGKRHYTVNWGLVAASAAVLCAAVPLGYWRYRTASEHMAGTLLERAAELEKEKQWDEATAYYQRYLIINPDDGGALTRMAEAFARGDLTPSRLNRVNTMLYRVLGQVPESEQSKYRLQLAENL